MLKRNHSTPMQNLSSVPRRRRRIRLSRRSIRLLSGLAISLTLFLCALIPPVLSAYHHGMAAKNELLAAKDSLGSQDFDAALAAADRSTIELNTTYRAISHLQTLKPLPFIGTQIKALDVIARVGLTLTDALHDGTVAAQQIIGPLQNTKGTVSLATLTPADKRQILQRLSESRPQLIAVKDDVTRASEMLKELPERGLVPPLNAAIAPIKEQIPFLQDAMDQLIPASTIIPAIVGFPTPQTYLFLLQNNTELRPTGGFIGTYGILKVSSAEITSFSTNDVYNLDTPVQDALHITPPTPLTKYNDTTQWFFRDSNWSPDFPTSAEKALEFYRLENGPQKTFDGVIAVTPTFVSSLLKISGDITIGTMTFTSDNLIDKLQPRADRKDLIGEMSKTLINRLLALPQNRWQELFSAVTTGLGQKQMLLYSKDASLEQQLLEQNWGGDVRSQPVDSLYIVDANLASLKTDGVMQRSIPYDLTVTNDAANATVSITYTNNGKFTATTSRYRTYTRIYVPLGSTLTGSSGALQNDKLHGAKAGTVDVSEDLGRTVFGAFISIEPGTSGTLSFTYTLPQAIIDAVKHGTYELHVQKQPGTPAHTLNATLNFTRTVASMTGVDGLSAIGHTGVALKSDLLEDRHLTVTFK